MLGQLNAAVGSATSMLQAGAAAIQSVNALNPAAKLGSILDAANPLAGGLPGLPKLPGLPGIPKFPPKLPGLSGGAPSFPGVEDLLGQVNSISTAAFDSVLKNLPKFPVGVPFDPAAIAKEAAAKAQGILPAAGALGSLVSAGEKIAGGPGGLLGAAKNSLGGVASGLASSALNAAQNGPLKQIGSAASQIVNAAPQIKMAVSGGINLLPGGAAVGAMITTGLGAGASNLLQTVTGGGGAAAAVDSLVGGLKNATGGIGGALAVASAAKTAVAGITGGGGGLNAAAAALGGNVGAKLAGGLDALKKGASDIKSALKTDGLESTMMAGLPKDVQASLSSLASAGSRIQLPKFDISPNPLSQQLESQFKDFLAPATSAVTAKLSAPGKNLVDGLKADAQKTLNAATGGLTNAAKSMVAGGLKNANPLTQIQNTLSAAQSSVNSASTAMKNLVGGVLPKG